MDFKRGGQVIQRLRMKNGMTQEQLAEKVNVAPNTISRIERGLLLPALPTLIDICNALETGADAVLADYIVKDTPIRWTPLAEKLKDIELEKQRQIEIILECMVETLQ